MDSPDVNLWQSPTHALEYLVKAETIPHRTEGEGVLLDCRPQQVTRVLDLGSGDGRLLRAMGFVDVDCLWKWRELALLTAMKPA